jgi:hypothetical protein
MQCGANDIGIGVRGEEWFLRDEREVGVAEILIDRSTARVPPCEHHSVLVHALDVTFLPRVLVSPDHDLRERESVCVCVCVGM